MNESLSIPLNKLFPWEGNVRKTHSTRSINEMAASITSHGLLQSLVVRKEKRGRYAVLAGRRRFLALSQLAEAGSIATDIPIACTLTAPSANPKELSLAENFQREPMHPADEFDAFRDLIEEGMPITDVAARFGVTENVVRQRLKLAQVSPVLIAAYRKDEMNLHQLMAFAVTDDQAAQESVWESLPEWQRGPEAIRGRLVKHEITANDRRVKFVTLDAYEGAGGNVRRDLFCENDAQGVFIDDIPLLIKLVADKLNEIAQSIQQEGWAWVEIRLSFDHEEQAEFARRFPERAPLPWEQQEQLDALMAEAESLGENDELDDEQEARLEELNGKIDALNDDAVVWPTETLAVAGAIVVLDWQGEADVFRGLVRDGDLPAKTEESESDDTPQKETKPSLPASLTESLTAHRSAALNAVLMTRPDIALAAAVQALAAQVFYHGHSSNTALELRANAVSLRMVEGSHASEAIAAAGADWETLLPSQPAHLFAWCLAQPQELLLKLLAFCVARTTNAVQEKSDRPESDRLEHAGHLADALKLDMTLWFKPTAANYFGKVSKAMIIEALTEAKGSSNPSWSVMKKAELAALAESEIATTDWLPVPLRAPIVETQSVAA